jgi:hypothetical protein
LDGSHGDANGTLRIGSEATADGQIEAHGYGYQCSLSLTKAGSQPPAIIVKQISPGCSNFLTPGASFAHTFPLRSKSNFYGNDLPLCYVAEDTARVALCGSQPLSKLEDEWRMLSYKTSDLSRKPIEVAEEEGKLVRACDDASDPAACLTGAFQSSMDAMNANNLAWLESVTEPGGADEAAPKIEAMAGSYRHIFPNGDVQGDKFTSTDTLTITKLSDTSVRYSLQLEFFNGHQCTRNGVASYRKAGFFVEQSKAELGNVAGQLCVFELIPANKGVELRDPTGICRTTDCGARGGYNGASFSLEERVAGGR